MNQINGFVMNVGIYKVAWLYRIERIERRSALFDSLK
jgi:hypothetical protein